MSFTQIKPLIVLHQRNKDAQSEFRSCLSAQEQFERSRWFSRSGWMRLGYQLKNKRDPIIQSFRTPKGTKSFHAYHACDVEIRPAVWAKMLRACGQSVCKPSLPNRRRIYAALMAEGQTSLAKRLKYSIGSSIVGQRDRIHHAWLSQKTEVAAAEADTAMREYSVILEPIVETRRVRALQRKYVAKLLDLGIHTDTTSIEELKSLLTNAEQERDRPRILAALGQFGVDAESLPALIPAHEVLQLMKYGGYLCTIPYELDLEGIFIDLKLRKKNLALWAFEHFPDRIKLTRCIQTPERSKIEFLNQKHINTKEKNP